MTQISEGLECLQECSHERKMPEGRKRRSWEELDSEHTVHTVHLSFDSVYHFRFCVFLLVVLVSGTLSRPFSLISK